MRKTTEGKCTFCGKITGKASMKRHVDSCKARAEEYITGESDHIITVELSRRLRRLGSSELLGFLRLCSTLFGQ